MGLLPGWQHYIDLTVPAEKVTEDLAHFPVCIQIKESAGINGVDLTPIFDEVGENYKKIAVTAEDGVTQLYVEVVSWDSITDEYAELHVSKSGWTLNGNVENKIRVYFDSNHADNDSFVGLTGSTPAQNVWDSNYVMVQHMNDATSTTIADSTSNGNTGTKKAVGEPLEVDGQIGKAQSFDGNDDDVDLGSDSTLDISQQSFTLETWIKLNTVSETYKFMIVLKGFHSGLYMYNDKITFSMWSIGSGNKKCDTGSFASVGTWYHVVGIHDADANTGSLYVNGDYKDGFSLSDPRDLDAFKWYIGSIDEDPTYALNGTIDHSTISNSTRSSAWVGASYETQRDQFYNCGDFVHLNPIALFCA